jgi:dihydrofolate reductase
MGKPIVMGRRTFESIGRPLPGRSNIVVSRDPGYCAESVHVVHSIDAALMLARRIATADGRDEVMVIGGAQLYAATLSRAARLYLTRVHATPQGDTLLPPIDWSEWQEVAREMHESDGEHPAHTFLYYTRNAC